MVPYTYDRSSLADFELNDFDNQEVHATRVRSANQNLHGVKSGTMCSTPLQKRNRKCTPMLACTQMDRTVRTEAMLKAG